MTRKLSALILAPTAAQVRLELTLPDGGKLAAQLTRSEVEELEVQPGDSVYVREDGQAPRFTSPAEAAA